MIPPRSRSAALRALGHNVSGWSLGTNRGPTGRVVDTLRERLDRLHRTSGRRVSLVGWSLGGLYAQELARAAPAACADWSPRNAGGAMGSVGAHRLGARRRRQPPAAWCSALPRPWAERGSLRVPATSVYTRADGIVHWSSCRYPVRARRENVEVRGSHLGLAYNPAVLWLLADRLGMAEGAWTPFRPRSGSACSSRAGGDTGRSWRGRPWVRRLQDARAGLLAEAVAEPHQAVDHRAAGHRNFGTTACPCHLR